MSTKRALAVAAVAVLAGGVAAAASDTDVAWIGKLPGLSMQTSRTTSSDGFKAIYTLSADADATMDSVRSGLTQRGWTIRKSADVPAGGVEVRTLTADKDGARVKVSLTNALGMGTLTVSLRGGTAGSSGSSSRSSGDLEDIIRGTVEGGAAATTGAGLMVVGNAVTETHDCNDGDVSVSGNSSGITLRGACRTVRVAGNANTVTIQGTVQAIHAVGRANTVIWSAAKNPRAPIVKHVGSQNRVHSDAERY